MSQPSLGFVGGADGPVTVFASGGGTALLVYLVLGGSVGALLGMRVFHHKTKHWYFVWGVPAILLAQLALAVWLLTR